MQAVNKELHSDAHANNRKRHDLAISLNFISRVKRALEMKLFFAKCQFEIEEKENQTKHKLEFYSPCILIGFLPFGLTRTAFSPLCHKHHAHSSRLKFHSVQLVNAPHTNNFAYRNDKNIFYALFLLPPTIQIIYYALPICMLAYCAFMCSFLCLNLLCSQFKWRKIIIPEWMKTAIEHFLLPFVVA